MYSTPPISDFFGKRPAAVPSLGAPSAVAGSWRSNPAGKRPAAHLLKGRHLGRVRNRFVAPRSRAHIMYGIAPAARIGAIGVALVQR